MKQTFCFGLIAIIAVSCQDIVFPMEDEPTYVSGNKPVVRFDRKTNFFIGSIGFSLRRSIEFR